METEQDNAAVCPVVVMNAFFIRYHGSATLTDIISMFLLIFVLSPASSWGLPSRRLRDGRRDRTNRRSRKNNATVRSHRTYNG